MGVPIVRTVSSHCAYFSFTRESRLFFFEIGLCAKGDDPITPSNGYRTIKIISDVQQSAGGLLRFTFNGQSFFFPPDANKWRDAECKTSFESLPNVESVNCTSKRLNARRTEYTVAFIKFPVEPYENNIFTNNGNPPLSVFSCDTSMITGSRKVSCEVLDMITGDDKNLPGKLIFKYNVGEVLWFYNKYFRVSHVLE